MVDEPKVNLQAIEPVKKTRFYHTTTKPSNNIQEQFMTIERFIDVSKVLINRFIDFLEVIKLDYKSFITQMKAELESKLAKGLQNFAVVTQELFVEVVRAHMAGYNSLSDHRKVIDGQIIDVPTAFAPKYNFTSLKHALKRIYKSC